MATAAYQALQTGDVNLILPYVKPDAESELIAAFKQALEVRQAGGEAQKLADRYFMETAVRLQRAGEGAPYTGLIDEAAPEAILVADDVMSTGSLDTAYSFLDQEIKKGIQDKYETVVKAREEAEKLGTVEAHRERVEAELTFEKYMYELWSLAMGEQSSEGGHTH